MKETTSESSSLTVLGTSGFKPGDTIAFKLPDNRKWKRFLHWILFMNPPVIKTYRTVSSVDSNTHMTIK